MMIATVALLPARVLLSPDYFRVKVVIIQGLEFLG